jgi:hypothetical protein
MKKCNETLVITWWKPNTMVESVALVVNATDASWIASLLAQTSHRQNVGVLPSHAVRKQ